MKLDLIKDILKFIFNLSMILFAIVIIVKGGNALGIGILAIIPFVYFVILYGYPKKED